MDHVIPRDRGGGTSWENVVISCIRCNSKKSNRLPKEAGMRLLKEPKRPLVDLSCLLCMESQWKRLGVTLFREKLRNTAFHPRYLLCDSLVMNCGS